MHSAFGRLPQVLQNEIYDFAIGTKEPWKKRYANVIAEFKEQSGYSSTSPAWFLRRVRYAHKLVQERKFITKRLEAKKQKAQRDFMLHLLLILFLVFLIRHISELESMWSKLNNF